MGQACTWAARAVTGGKGCIPQCASVLVTGQAGVTHGGIGWRLPPGCLFPAVPVCPPTHLVRPAASEEKDVSTSRYRTSVCAVPLGVVTPPPPAASPNTPPLVPLAY